MPNAKFQDVAIGDRVKTVDGGILVVEEKDELRVILHVEGEYRKTVSYYQSEFDALNVELLPAPPAPKRRK